MSDTYTKICSLCEDIKEIGADQGTDLMVMSKAEEIIHLIKLKYRAWEHLWDAPDGSFKAKCKTCGFTTYFIEGHDAQYKYCPQCGEQKIPRKLG